MTPTNLSAALEYARRGWRVFPLHWPLWLPDHDGAASCSCGQATCDRVAKHPLAKAAPNGLKDATSDESVIRAWWTRYPQANIGLATGPESGVAVIDIDQGGEETLAALEAKLGKLPPTLEQRTGSGGRHLVFAYPASGVRSVNGTVRAGYGPKVDSKGLGGYIVVAPSQHATGERYEWRTQAPLAELPPAFAALVPLERKPDVAPPAPPRAPSDPTTAYERARRYLATMSSAVSGSGGHTATFKAAIALVRGFCLPEADALELLASEYNPRCQPPWSERELRHKVETAAKDGSVPAGYLLDAPPPERVPRPARAPEPPPPSDDDAPPPSARVYALRATHPAAYTASAKTDGTAALAPEPPPAPTGGIPLTKSYASICQVLRTPSLRRLVLGEGELEFNEQTLMPCIARRPIVDEDISRIRELAELNFTAKKKGIQFARGDIEQAVLQVAHENPFHPVADYLRGLRWDGTKRLDFVARDILGVDTSAGEEGQPLAGRMLRKFMISAVARALQPGCKVDTVLILQGPQGAQKSTFFRTLAGDTHFSDSSIDIHNKDSFLVLRAVWLLEWAELDAMQRAKDARAVKAFITSSTDHLRPPYERAVRAVPRSSVIVGTTNDRDFLRDPTGSRRYWPVSIQGRVNLKLLAEQRDQLWAEAVHSFDASEPWWLDAADEGELKKAHDAYVQRDAWEDLVVEWATRQLVAFTTADVLLNAVKKDSGQWSRADEMRVADILTRNGWEQGRPRGTDGKRLRAWRRP